MDNGTEFTSKALEAWAYECGVKVDYMPPGKPAHNRLIGSFNCRLREPSRALVCPRFRVHALGQTVPD